MISIKLNPNDIYKGDLVLINREHPIKLDGNQIVSDLEIIDSRFKDQMACSHIVKVLKEIFNKLNSHNEIIPVSCFRSSKEQEVLYKKSIIENGLEFTKKYVAYPDASEHQSGLAVDLGKNDMNIDFICPDFPYYGVFLDFRREALKNGFIERYKEGKEAITGIAHEPWHFRYVGAPHSVIMEEKGLALEEYIQFIKSFNSPDNSFVYRNKSYIAKVFYISSDGQSQTIDIEHDYKYSISGNNIDGFIITLYNDVMSCFTRLEA